MQKKWIISLSALLVSLPGWSQGREDVGIPAKQAEPQPEVRARSEDTVRMVLGPHTVEMQQSFQDAQDTIGKLRKELMVRGKTEPSPSKDKIAKYGKELNGEVGHAAGHREAVLEKTKPYPLIKSNDDFNGIVYAAEQADVINKSLQGRLERGEYFSNRAAVLTDLGQLEAALAAGIQSAQGFNQAAGIAGEVGKR